MPVWLWFSEFYTSPIKSTHNFDIVDNVDTSYRRRACRRNMFPTSPNPLRHVKMDVLAMDLEDEPESCRFAEQLLLLKDAVGVQEELLKSVAGAVLLPSNRRSTYITYVPITESSSRVRKVSIQQHAPE